MAAKQGQSPTNTLSGLAAVAQAHAVEMFHRVRVLTVDAIGQDKTDAALTAACNAVLQSSGPALAERMNTRRPACERGCDYCCHVAVHGSMFETLRVVQYLREHELDPFAGGSPGHVRAERRVSLMHRRPCQLLSSSGACSVYEARPLACRGWHSLDLERCKTVFHSEGPLVDVPQVPGVMTMASALSFALCTAAADLRLDGRPVVLATAVRRALEDPEWPARWAGGESLPKDVVDAAATKEWAQSGAPSLSESRTVVSRLPSRSP